MKHFIRSLFVTTALLMVISQSWARELQDTDGHKSSYPLKQTSAGCAPAAGFEWLDINNARVRINTGGDMWWDLVGGTGAKYFIPKSGSATSMFSAALWIGGLDINNQLKLAALRYRQVGNDYWTGPLTVDGTAAIDEATCAEFDRHWKMTREMVDEFLGHTDPITGAFIPDEEYNIPKEILDWPAHGDVSKQQSFYLAPFYDVDGDGEYNPYAGDYPYYDIDNSLCGTKTPTMDESVEGVIWGSVLADQVIKGDQTIWWVFNDKGNFHTETNGAAIGLEIRAQAFAFATNDEINNMTFYSYEIINRSTFELTNTFFSQWVDPDLGYAWDDFVGCDVQRGLGYCYNGKDFDGSGEPESYGAQPPAIGVDFFQGPYMDPLPYDRPKYRFSVDPVTGDTIQEQLCDESINGINFGDGIPGNERFGMRRFLFHNNTSSPMGDPRTAPEYYNVLRGKWRYGEPMSYGGNAFPGDPGVVGPECDFMFPGDTDPCNWGTGGMPPNGGYNQDGYYWTEETGNNGQPNDPNDRRFLHSAGPFTLKPGAVNYITVGIPWARASSGGAKASVDLLRVVDDKCQALFDNCFKVIDGPNAPDLSFQELDRELIVYISNSPSSNNFGESYEEHDPNIIQPHPNPSFEGERSDSIYRFEGYQIFQLKDPTVGVENIKDPALVRLVAQFDKKNGVGKIVNYYFDESIGATVPVVEVRGGDNGIQHSFRITQDAFATGDVRLVNHKQYYYVALAYAFNEYMPYSDSPTEVAGLFGQKIPYLAGRKNIKTYTAIPHKTVNGTVFRSNFGDQPEITRIAGHGNGGMNLDLTEKTIDEIMNKPPAGPDNRLGDPDYPIAYNPVYKKNAGPLNVKIIDPLNVVGTDYEFWLDTLRYVKIYNVSGEPEIRGDTASKHISKWVLKDLTTGEIYHSDTTTLANDEQLFLDRGISVQVNQPYKPGPYRVGNNKDNKMMYRVLAANNGLIESTIHYADSSRRWLGGIADNDEPGSPLNWIRSGTYKSQEDSKDDDWQMSTDPERPWDPSEYYEKIIGGTWAPYALVSYGNNFGQGGVQSQVGPAYSEDSKANSRFDNLTSVDIVLTPDKSKWTRSPVLEMQIDRTLAEGNAYRLGLRRSPSVDKEGNSASAMDLEPSNNPSDPHYIGSYGMGWFPGYAINIETGERLNIMFGEDSYASAQNGRDMLFNPPALDPDIPQELDPNVFSLVSRRPVFAGQHYVYIMRHDRFRFDMLDMEFYSPAYDAGQMAFHMLDTLFQTQFPYVTSFFYSQIMYVGMPTAVKGQEWLSNEVKIRIRVSKPYSRHHALIPLETNYDELTENNGYPKYSFSTKDMAAEQRNPDKLDTDLDLITVVPNPYYAYSAYERNPLDNRIKIANLPEKCTITIYNISGTKIRQFKKDEPKTSIDWDLKNFAGVPIASGVYIIHVKSDEGERVVKWFGTLRPIDLNTF
ncbi:MAG: T9SS type A sorting domain-containing protein [Bacteroidales bacterium]|nr:T9SS type A sorting domain-containing protein [Bacteroidales bacterium]MDD3701065.1 T9SS type A sorting domain-containing protein [Bacteroidales bacterium]MDY0369297.1 T9SS type A sorting domain-containing protein [Bacteroidales bacterium]